MSTTFTMQDLLVEEIELREEVREAAEELGMDALCELLSDYKSDVDSWTFALAEDLRSRGVTTASETNLRVAGLAVALGCLVDRLGRLRAAAAIASGEGGMVLSGSSDPGEA